MTSNPSQGELFLPFLETLREAEGRPLRPADVYARVADKLRLSPEVREAAVQTAAGSTRVLDRNVRWVQQRAKLAGFVSSPERNLWQLTEAGAEALQNAQPGVVVTVFETDLGVALWAETQSAVSLLEDGIVNTIVTSPPYALVHRKEYANQHAGAAHADWLFTCIRDWIRPLSGDGSIFLNLGDVWTPGRPSMDLYQERLILRLCDELSLNLNQKLFWENPSKMPSPAEWVTVRRCRVTPSIEQVWWLGKGDPRETKADNRKVLRPYSASMQSLLGRGGERGAVRPSGHTLRAGAFAKDNGGAIPHSLLTFANTSSNDSYAVYCKQHGLPRHPARFPSDLVEWLLKLTTDEGDVVWDPFGGSLTTAGVCERMNRRWIACDKSLSYLRGGFGRLGGACGARAHTAL